MWDSLDHPRRHRKGSNYKDFSIKFVYIRINIMYLYKICQNQENIEQNIECFDLIQILIVRGQFLHYVVAGNIRFQKQHRLC